MKQLIMVAASRFAYYYTSMKQPSFLSKVSLDIVCLFVAVSLLVATGCGMARAHDGDTTEVTATERPKRPELTRPTPSILPSSSTDTSAIDTMELRKKKAKEFTALRDAKLRQRAQSVHERIEKIQTKKTDHYLNHLTRIDKLLTKIETRLTVATSEGRDTTTFVVTLASLKQQADILTAEAQTLQTKEYTISDPSDERIKGQFQDVHKQFVSDHQAYREKLIAYTVSVRTFVGQLTKALAAEASPKTEVE